jgi:transcriptional regulator with XRE-family HTH domain
MLFGEKLREIRIAKEFTQKSLADAANTHQQNIARWESGEVVPGFNDVLVLCRALKIRCTAFEDCEFAATTKKRKRGRPVENK